MTEVEALRAALKWALENGARYSEPYKRRDGSIGGGDFSDHGCGCCSDRVEPPDDLKDTILAALGKSDAT